MKSHNNIEINRPIAFNQGFGSGTTYTEEATVKKHNIDIYTFVPKKKNEEQNRMD